MRRHPLWSRHLRGHLLLFDREPAPSPSPHAGVRLLLAAGVVELARIVVVTWLYPDAPVWLLAPALLGLALLAVPGIAGIRLSQLGFRRWRNWTTTEKSYFLQVIAIANVVFPIVLAGQIRNRAAQPGLAWSLCTVFVPYLFFGFYQELVYRGMVQLELTRRWGASAGTPMSSGVWARYPLGEGRDASTPGSGGRAGKRPDRVAAPHRPFSDVHHRRRPRARRQ